MSMLEWVTVWVMTAAVVQKQPIYGFKQSVGCLDVRQTSAGVT